MPRVSPGMTKPVDRWSKVSFAAISMGQEIGISAVQLTSLISTIANDGVRVPARIVAGTIAPQNAPQTIAFQPVEGTRVISSLTAAQMRQMLQGVVLHGTGRKALLEGYSSAGKTGTAQKVDPATGAYSKTKYVASFAGFAPINNPQIAVVVILDSAVGLHQGGQVSAPVFQRIVQQVLEYQHVPHDVELPPSRQVLLARRNVPDKNLEESSPDHLGASLDMTEAAAETLMAQAQSKPAAGSSAASSTYSAHVVPTALTQRAQAHAEFAMANSSSSQAEDAVTKLASSRTVVLDVEEGGIEMPSFIGKNVRGALEAAQAAGLDLDAVGSGVAREQSPQPGARVPAGARVLVRFAR
jgi:cell division protein FtsI (penicillin-binding protein 3)